MMVFSINFSLKWLSVSLLTFASIGSVNAAENSITESSVIENQANTTITLTQQGITLEYDQAVRIDRVLSDTLNQQYLAQTSSSDSSPFYSSPYFPPYQEGYKLFNLEKQNQANALLNRTIKQLESLSQDSDYQQSAMILIQQLKPLSFAYREKVNLDFDAIRLDPTLNPSLPGAYALELNSRPNTIHFFGLVEQTQQPFDASKALDDYIQQAVPLAQSNRSDVWIIFPDGRTQKAGFAYWNNQHLNLMPGTTVFMGLNPSYLNILGLGALESVFSDNDIQQLEHDIVTLLGFILHSPIQREIKG